MGAKTLLQVEKMRYWILSEVKLEECVSAGVASASNFHLVNLETQKGRGYYLSNPGAYDHGSH